MDKIYGQFDIETIEKLAEIVSSKNLSEITLSNGDNSITVKGQKVQVVQSVQAQAVPQVNAPAPSVSENKTADTISGNIVKSPIVGTFYAAPSPDKPAFVKVGDTVKKGDVIMIIESMKLMNEIQSDFDGIVEKILVSDGQAVEYDQPIMIIK
ncbi:MAG: acetyl-CoA carboxylase biotin carboxyl carrier protein [Ruminococcus sp.]|nr:acetyl-CoA carboxylase biotin carboxyl carrier protein [Ruminococcus sp.]MDE6848740.1 acetyl-CoA carboxylase biotin carboxyl carrier protein [Ruminococcus sp.]